MFPPTLVEFTPFEGNPVFQGAGPGHWDEMIRERGWILHEDNVFHLWYTGYSPTQSGGMRKLGYATSPDGLTWTRYPGNPICTEYWVEDVMVIKHEATYYMFAESKSDEAHLLTSTDRLHWKEEGRLDIRSANGKPISPGHFGTPTAFYEAGTWYLYYERDDEAIWLATSKDLKVWINVQDKPVLERGPDAYDLDMLALDQIVKFEGRYYAYYHGLIPHSIPQEWTSAIAVSADLLHWEKYSGNPILRGDKSSPVLVEHDSAYWLYTMHPAVCVYRHAQSAPSLLPAPAH